MATKKFQELLVWQKAHQFVLMAHKYSASFPKTYGLTSQLRRALVSITANIVEGYKKKVKADKARFFDISQGSIAECEYYIVLSRDLEYGENTRLEIALEEI